MAVGNNFGDCGSQLMIKSFVYFNRMPDFKLSLWRLFFGIFNCLVGSVDPQNRIFNADWIGGDIFTVGNTMIFGSQAPIKLIAVCQDESFLCFTILFNQIASQLIDIPIERINFVLVGDAIEASYFSLIKRLRIETVHGYKKSTEREGKNFFKFRLRSQPSQTWLFKLAISGAPLSCLIKSVGIDRRLTKMGVANVRMKPELY